MPARSRLTRWALGLALSGALLLVRVAPAAPPTVELRASSAEFVELDVWPDWNVTSSGFLVVVPPQREPHLDLVQDDATQLESPSMGPLSTDDRVLPAHAAALRERARIGGYDLVRVEVAARTRGSEAGTMATHARLRLRVRFEPLVTESSAPVRTGNPVGRQRAIETSGEEGRPAERSRQGQRGRGLRAPADELGPVAAAVLDVAVNAGSARGWRTRPAQSTAVPAAALTGPPVGCDKCVKVAVSVDGLYRISHADLDALPGYDLSSLDPRRFHLRRGGDEVAMSIEGESDGSFDPDDSIVFLGLRNTARHTDTAVYWLIPESDDGLRMTVANAVLPGDEALPSAASVVDVVRLEEQLVYHSLMANPSEDKDPWMVYYLRSNGGWSDYVDLPTPAALDLPWLAVPTAGQDYRLRARFSGLLNAGTADSQQVAFEVNGTTVHIESWAADPAGLEHAVDVSYDAGLLAARGNRVRVRQPDPIDPFEWRLNYLDYVELEYPRRLVAEAGESDFQARPDKSMVYYVGGFSGSDVDIYSFGAGQASRIVGPKVLSAGPGLPLTIAFALRPSGTSAPLRVVAVEPSAYRSPGLLLDTPSSLRGTAGDDYLIIAHSRFVTEAEVLATYRNGRVVDLTDVYDEFNWGFEHPDAIRALLEHAYSNWTPRPTNVVLVGDASFDFRNHLGIVDPWYDPPSLLHAHDTFLRSVAGLRAASDSWFVAVDGADFVPDIAFGRIPARRPGEVANFVQKLISYEAQPTSSWMARVQLFADDDRSCGGSFASDLEALVSAHVDPSSNNLKRRYAPDYDEPPGEPARLRTDVLSDLAAGVGLQVYSGHANVFTMGDHCAAVDFPILERASLTSLPSSSKLPLGVAMTCDVGEFDFVGLVDSVPVTESLAEIYLMAPDRGHIAWLATTTVLLYVSGHDMIDSLFEVLYQGTPPGNRVLGTVAISVALDQFADKGSLAQDLIETMAVLGDPATTLKHTSP